MRQMWIQVGIAYGFPNSVQHTNRTYRTECLLDELITRVACQGRGPRIVAGDFNHAAHELLQLQRLRDLGFVEIQDLAASQWGHEVQPTSAGPWVNRSDPEMEVLLNDVLVSWDTWSCACNCPKPPFATLVLNLIDHLGTYLLLFLGLSLGMHPVWWIGLIPLLGLLRGGSSLNNLPLLV